MSGANHNKDLQHVPGLKGGIALIPSPTPLVRLHYFDGKLLRADDLQLEQNGLRKFIMLSNQAGGAGIVHGYDVTLGDGDRIDLGPGLAIDPHGRTLLLPHAAAININDLLAAAKGEAKPAPAQAQQDKAQFGPCEPVLAQPPGGGPYGAELWLVTLAHAEALCGSEDVLGNPCEAPCVASTDRPYTVEGVLVRAIPLQLQHLPPTSKAVALTQLHLRSQIAAAYFADDRTRVASLISGEGLRSLAWCLGSLPEAGCDVPIAVLARAGATTLFLDPWIPRRERIDPPPRSYWARRMAMRPWSGFIAEVLQFQCHLRDILGGLHVGEDPCKNTKQTAEQAAGAINDVIEYYSKVSELLAKLDLDALPELKGGLKGLKELQDKLAVAGKPGDVVSGERLLINGGIVELPSAGYLPVVPGPTLQAQVKRLLGPGVDLRFCAVRPDYVAHALEEAQHMDRISLIAGLDDPSARPQVDILVPDGQLSGWTAPLVGIEVAFKIATEDTSDTGQGAGRSERLPGGGAAIHVATQFTRQSRDPKQQQLMMQALPLKHALFLTASVDRDPFKAVPGDSIAVRARVAILLNRPDENPAFDLNDNEVSGELTVESVGATVEGKLSLTSGDKTTESTATLSLETVGQSTVIKVKIAGFGDVDLEVAVGWPDSVTYAGTLKATKVDNGVVRTTVMIHTKTLVDSAVLQPADPRHVLALAAVAAIADAKQDPAFETAATELLFPSPAQGGGTVVATRDWVLFHRRRDRQCAGAPVVRPAPQLPPAPLPKPIEQPQEPAPQPAFDRSYHVYVTDIQNFNQAQVAEALRAGEAAVQKLNCILLGTAVFLGDSATLKNGDGLRQAWATKDYGELLNYAAIVHAGAAKDDGDDSAGARLGAVVASLAPETAPRNLVSDLLPSVPATLSGLHGVIVLGHSEELPR